MYRYGPSRDNAKWRWISWGAGAATLLWVVASALFSLYVTSFGNFNETYGSLGAVVVLMMWLYLTAFLVLMGAEVDAEMEHQTARDTTQGPEQPLGGRGAHVADHVAPTPFQ
jgi:membrane protein